TDLLSSRAVFINDLVNDSVVFGQMRLLLQPPGGIIFIYALEKELCIRAKNNAARKASRVVDAINDLAARLAIRFRGGRDRFVFRVVILIRGARTVSVQRNGDTNRVV